MIRVSVIIPCYNAEETISKTIESVISQTYKEYEIIVIDDGSTDNTVDTVYRNFTNVKIFSQKNSGVSVARNKGVSLAKGELIAFLDSDDIWMPEKLEKQVAVIDFGYDMVHNPANNVCKIGSNEWIPDTTVIKEVKEGDYLKELFTGNFIVTSSVVIKKDCLVDVGGFRKNFKNCQDWDLWIRVASKYRIFQINKFLVLYQVREDSLSSNVTPVYRSSLDVIKFNKSLLGKNDRKQVVRIAHANLMLNTCWRYLKANDRKQALVFALKGVIRNPLNVEGYKWCIRSIFR